MQKFKIGDRVKLTRPCKEWSGWMDSMNERIGREFTVKSIHSDEQFENDWIHSGSRYEYLKNGWIRLDDGIPYNYPVDCFDLIEENKMNFGKGDLVEVIKRVDQENGWDNGWVSYMNLAMGQEFTVDRVDNTGIYFVSNNDDKLSDYGFPPSSLKLIDEFVQAKPEIKTEIDPVIKYQYLKGTDFYTIDGWADNLCLTIATKIKTSKVHSDKTVEWTVAFKHPNDQFNKSLARDAVNSKIPKRLFLGKRYSRDEIVGKILADLVYNDYFLSDEYRRFVRLLLKTYSSVI
jgi:hypothetical protein